MATTRKLQEQLKKTPKVVEPDGGSLTSGILQVSYSIAGLLPFNKQPDLETNADAFCEMMSLLVSRQC